jgi:quinol monooxygenase YgiN
MVTKGLFVHLDAKHGMDGPVEQFLLDAVPIVRAETGTSAWFAVSFGRGEYGIFDVFPDAAARDVHLAGGVAAALMARSSELFHHAPRVEKLDVLASKLPTGIGAALDTRGLLLSFEAKAGHEAQVAQFLTDARTFVLDETGTTAWFAVRFDRGDYGIFDVFPDNGARFVHLTGHVPRELAKHAMTLMGSMPEMHMLNVLAETFTTSS